MIQIEKDLLLIGTTTNSILTAQLSSTSQRNPLADAQLNQVPLTQVMGIVLSNIPVHSSSSVVF